MGMNILFGDFESVYSGEYSLKKITPVEYILDHRFEALGGGFIENDGAPFWVDGPDLQRYFDSVPWDKTYFISHNALFDACVLKWRFGKNPKLLGDTLGMARAWVGHLTGRVSLDALAAHFQMPAKMQTVRKMEHYTYDMLRANDALYQETVAYGCDDVAKCKEIFLRILRDGFPVDQLEKLDMVLRMATDPVFVVDQQLLLDHAKDIEEKKNTLLARCGLQDRDALMSDELLAMLLMSLGVDPPRKVSKVTGIEGWAFAKTDKDFADLEEHEDPDVQAIVAARLSFKSTIEETRTGRFIDVSGVRWRFGEHICSMPIALKYSGAHTHRLSGDWKLNQQNLGRGSKLRKALKAPKGKKVVSADASQIEARILAVLAGQHDLVQAFREKRDVYSEFADSVFGLPAGTVNRNTHPKERQLGKVGILSLGYSAQWMTFKGMVRAQSGGKIEVTDSEASRIVAVYRQRYPAIPRYWKTWGDLIPAIANGSATGTQIGPITIGFQCLILPNGMKLHYHNLRQETYDGKLKWVYNHGPRIKSLYGAKIVENIVQALAFIHIIDCAIRIKHMTHGRLMPAHQVHDELIYVVEENIAEAVGKLAAGVIGTPPRWMPQAPLAAEWGCGNSYGEIDK